MNRVAWILFALAAAAAGCETAGQNNQGITETIIPGSAPERSRDPRLESLQTEDRAPRSATGDVLGKARAL